MEVQMSPLRSETDLGLRFPLSPAPSSTADKNEHDLAATVMDKAAEGIDDKYSWIPASPLSELGPTPVLDWLDDSKEEVLVKEADIPELDLTSSAGDKHLVDKAVLIKKAETPEPNLIDSAVAKHVEVKAISAKVTEPIQQVVGRKRTAPEDGLLEAQGSNKKRLIVKLGSPARKYLIVTVKFPTPPGSLLPPIGRPSIVALRRQALCDTLPYFHAFKGSLHTQNCEARGFLVDNYSGNGDIFTDCVVITEVGGCKQMDAATGRMTRIKDAKEDDINVKALKNSMTRGVPVAMIAGEGHPHWPCMKPKYAYVVLDFFHITDMWAEKKPGTNFRVYKIRFEKADLTKISWWATKTAQDKPMKAPVKECSVCGKVSKEMFTAGWTCVTPECSEFFHIGTATELKYTEEFLAERSLYIGPLPPLLPPLPDLSSTHGTEGVCRKGVVCARCGCCISRRHWKGWVCLNGDCGWVLPGSMRALPAQAVEKEKKAMDVKIKRRRHMNDITADMDAIATILHKPSKISPQCVGMIALAGYQVHQYLLPNNHGIIIGSFTMFVANDTINKAENGPNALLADIEQVEFGLSRNPAAIPNNKLEGLTRHFAQNFGAPYKYGVKVRSKAFSEAPEPVLRALHMVRWAAQHAVEMTASVLGTKSHDSYKNVPFTQEEEFNEMLALGYMERDRISYHDDGEKELGPTVAALSLGSPSFMKFRPKWKKDLSFPGIREKKASGGRGKKCYADVLEVPMKHGDIMVMHGAEIQRYYDHAVAPEGQRRFALTGRFVDPAKMDTPEEKEAALTDGVIPEWSFNKYAYKPEEL